MADSELIEMIERAKADLVQRHNTLRSHKTRRPRAWSFWSWFFLLLLTALVCTSNTIMAMYRGEPWTMIYAYTMVMVNVVTMVVHYESYRIAMVEYIKWQGEQELLNRFVANALAEYDADIARLRTAE